MRIDLASYGITAGGVGDDGPALRAALADLSSQGYASATLPAGTYLLRRDGGKTHCLELPISLIGESRGGTTLIFSPDDTNAKGVAIYRSGITLANMTLDGQWGGDSTDHPNRHNVIVGNGAEYTALRDLTSRRANGDGIYLAECNYTRIEGTGSEPLLVDGCRRNSITCGKQIDGVLVQHVRLDNCGTQHIDSEPKTAGVTVDNVIVDRVRFGACEGSAIATPSGNKAEFNRNWVIERCEFHDNGGIQVRWVDGCVVDRNHFYRSPYNPVYLRLGSRNCKVTRNHFETLNHGVLVESQRNSRVESALIAGNTFRMLGGSVGRAISLNSPRDCQVVDNYIEWPDEPTPGDVREAISLYNRFDVDSVIIRGNIIRGCHRAIQLGWTGMSARILVVDIAHNVARTGSAAGTGPTVGLQATNVQIDRINADPNMWIGFDAQTVGI